LTIYIPRLVSAIQFDEIDTRREGKNTGSSGNRGKVDLVSKRPESVVATIAKRRRAEIEENDVAQTLDSHPGRNVMLVELSLKHKKSDGGAPPQLPNTGIADLQDREQTDRQIPISLRVAKGL
jgi:hypothetical protein